MIHQLGDVYSSQKAFLASAADNYQQLLMPRLRLNSLLNFPSEHCWWWWWWTRRSTGRLTGRLIRWPTTTSWPEFPIGVLYSGFFWLKNSRAPIYGMSNYLLNFPTKLCPKNIQVTFASQPISCISQNPLKCAIYPIYTHPVALTTIFFLCLCPVPRSRPNLLLIFPSECSPTVLLAT